MNLKDWTMPEWMEPFRPMLDSRCGGCSVEDLMRDQHTTLMNNAVRAVFCVLCKNLVSLLEQLHKEDLLHERSLGPNENQFGDTSHARDAFDL